MFTQVRGAVAVGHRVELQQLLDHDSARKFLRLGCSVRLKGSSHNGSVIKLLPGGAVVKLSAPPRSAPEANATASTSAKEVSAAVDEIIVRLKGSVLATRVFPDAAAAPPMPLASYQVQVSTEFGDIWAEAFFVAVVLNQRQMKSFDMLKSVSSQSNSNSLQHFCTHGDASLLQVTRRQIHALVACIRCPFSLHSTNFLFVGVFVLVR
jgi:hypothetical protein